MRILHTADWHLGRRLNRVSRLAEQRELLADLVDQADRVDPDLVVVAGDVYDVFTPGADAERLYYDTVQRLADDGSRPVVVVAGNHDSPARLTAPRGLLEDQGVFVFGDPHDPRDVPAVRGHDGFAIEDAGPGWLDLDAGDERAIVHALPYPGRARLPSHVDDQDATAAEIVRTLADEVPEGQPRYLVSHLYVSSDHDVEQDRNDYLGGQYAVDPEALTGYDAAFLGHLHRPFPRADWHYAGAPMAFDFDDPDVDRGAWLHEAGEWKRLPLAGARRLAEHQVASLDEALALADGDERTWTRLVFERGTVIERRTRQRLREAFGDRLVDIRWTQPTQDGETPQPTVDLGETDPETAFCRYVEETDGEEPDEELVELFLAILHPDADGTEEPEPDAEAEATQATLEVET
jgi:exonuclease SbcD